MAANGLEIAAIGSIVATGPVNGANCGDRANPANPANPGPALGASPRKASAVMAATNCRNLGPPDP